LGYLFLQKRIFIHVGPPKTGTSAIQFWLHQNISHLTENKVFYPFHYMSSNGVSSGNLREIYDVLPDNSLRLNNQKVQCLLAEFENGDYTTMLLSSEFFFNKLEELKDNFVSAKFIFYMRNPVEIRESNYNQSVKRHGNTEALLPSDSGHIPHLEKLAIFNEKFGSKDIILKFYGDTFFYKGSIISDFLSIIGLSGLSESKSINQSYQFEALEFKRWLNNHDIRNFQTVIDNALQNFSAGCSDYSLFNQSQYLVQCEIFIGVMKPLFKTLGVDGAEIFFKNMRQKTLCSYTNQILEDEQFLQVAAFLQKKLGRTYYLLMHKILHDEHDNNCRFINLIRGTMTNPFRSIIYMGLAKVTLHKLWQKTLNHRGWIRLVKTRLIRIQHFLVAATIHMNRPLKIKLVAVAKNEAAYLSEWIFHHLYFGFDDISIYVNGTTDNTDDIVNNMKSLDKVHFHNGDDYYQSDIRSPQNKIYSDELALSLKQGFSHVMFLDIDEFWIPKNLKDSIYTYAENNSSDVNSFEWINRVNESEIFASPLNTIIQGVKTSQIKSLIKTGLNVVAVNPHSILAKKATYQLADGTSFMPVKGNIKAPVTELNKPVKDYFVLHRMYRSDIEYVAMIGRPTAVNNTSNSRLFKENRHGYCLTNTSIEVNLSIDDLKLYNVAYSQFLKNYSLNLAIATAHKLIVEKYHHTVLSIREAPVDEAQLIKRLLRNVTLKPVVNAYVDFKKRHRIND
jgi:hypothetical protein